jgi:hypothetical protein
MLHELQHWVQTKERFPRGSSPEEIAKIETPEMAKLNERLGQLFYVEERNPKNEKEFTALMAQLKKLKEIQADNSFSLYKRVEGEAQARNTQERMFMDEQARRSRTPLGNFDVPVSELVQMGEYGQLANTSRVPGAPASIDPPMKMTLPSSTTAKEDLAKVEAPSIMTRSDITELADYIKNREGGYGLRRVERAADEIPRLGELYTPEALRSAFSADNARALMTLKPSEFERYSAPLLKDLSQKSKDNIANLRVIQSAGGFEDVPFFLVNKERAGSTGLPFITGHEGRHRSRAMDEAGVQAGLVQFLPRAELREPFPRRSQEQYIDAIRKEMALSGNKIKPEKYYLNETDEKSFQRPTIDLPDLYAKGGEVTEFPEEQASPTQQDLSEAAKRLLYYKKTAAPTPPTDLARLGKQAGLIGLGFAPGSGVADYFGKFPAVEGGTEPSAVENFQKGNYGTAALQGLGAMGDLAMAVPVAGAAIGSVMKAPRTAQRILSSSTTAKDDLAKMPGVLPKAERDANLNKMLEESAVKDRMYHGTTENINEFKPRTGDAVFLTPDPKFANKFAWNDMLYTDSSPNDGFINPSANVLPVYVQVKNPFDYENPKHIRSVLSNLDPQDKKAFKKAASEGSWQEIEKHIGTIQDTGFDAVFLKEMGRKNLAVFDPSKIKSATGNRGTYDTTTPDITKAKGGEVRKPK